MFFLNFEYFLQKGDHHGYFEELWLGKSNESAKKGNNRTGKQQAPGKSHSNREDKAKRGNVENHSMKNKSSGRKSGGKGYGGQNCLTHDLNF